MSGRDKAPDYDGSGSVWAPIIGAILAVPFSATLARLYFASAAADGIRDL